MLFRKKLVRSCTYCKHGTKIDDISVLCVKRGVVRCKSSCRKFSYDPCKRVPVRAKALNFVKFSAEDFSL